MARSRTVKMLLETRLLAVGEFRCPPDDESWDATNVIGKHAHVVFPRIPVVIRQAGHEAVLATPNHTMLYNAGQRYDREQRSEGGDDCVFVELPEASLASLVDEGAQLVDGESRLRATHAPTDRRTYLLQHLLVRRLRSERGDALVAEELAVRLVLAALTSAPPRRRPGRAEGARRELAEAAKGELASELGARLTLVEVAARLHTSPFHLSRVFRAETGFTLSGFRRSLRLRAALERLPACRRELSSLALELGFSSHSHFTTSFGREFGVPPSAVSDPRAARALLQAA